MSFILGKRQDSLRKDEKKVLKPVISINILDLGRVDISNQLVVGASHSHFNSIYPYPYESLNVLLKVRRT